jgi:repressor LexA
MEAERKRVELRCRGVVRAGFPSAAEEELADVLSLDEWLVRRPEASFLLRVEGDSMVEAGILPGDVVLVERGFAPRDGDIVVAQVDGDWTLKYLRRDGGGPILEPANVHYGTVRPRRSLSVEGVVRAVVRRYP